jgi:hypothetical protein
MSHGELRDEALVVPLLRLAVRRSIARDLRNLKRVLDAGPQPNGL